MASPESIDDPLLKELLTSFKQDSQRVATDILQGAWVQAGIAIVSLFLAIGSVVRVIGYWFIDFPGRPHPPSFFVAFDLSLTVILFILSIYSLIRYLILRERYSRLSVLAEKLGR